VPRAAVEAAVEEARTTGRHLGEVLIDHGLASERDVYRALARLHGVVFAEAGELIEIADPALLRRVPRTFLAHHQVVPIARVERRVVVATSSPLTEVPELAGPLGAMSIEHRLVTPTDLRRILNALELGQVGTRPVAPAAQPGRDLLSHGTEIDAELVALFDAILLDAIGERASDIHLEIYGPRVRVRLRVDGDLRDATHFHLGREQLLGIINVLKVKANLDIAERRAPQGGRFTTSAGGHAFDLRVQTQATLHGEHAVVRLLPQDSRLLTIEDLGLSPRVAAAYRRLLDSPSGLVLVVGPTGSGKSTTLYAGLQALARDATRKVITVEDPIEYAVDGIQQSQVMPEVGFTFATAMRAFVREDPDVILVGEVRDGETALETLRASQTGHLVLSTLHCNDAVDAVQRLFDLGMHENSVASELQAVLAQRLAKRICEGCRVPSIPAPALVHEIFGEAGLPAGLATYRGTGCPRCRGSGSFGRVAAVELLPTTAAVRHGIAHRLPVDELRQLALRAGLVPMRDEALALVGAGVIALEELPWLLPPERLRAEGGEAPLYVHTPPG